MISRGTAIIIFVRQPTLGKVKTRLAKTLGDAFALDFYALCTRQVLSELRTRAGSAGEMTPFVFVAEAQDLAAIRTSHGDSFEYRAQQGFDLGERMYNAFREVFSLGAKQAIIVGSDVPNLSCSIVSEAKATLQSHDAVLGPSTDGGYYLLGLRDSHRPLFFDMPWSTGTVAELTRERLRQLGLSFRELEPLPDIDDESDLIDWLRGPHSTHHPLKAPIQKMLEGTCESR